MTRFTAPISEQIWDMKYRFKDAQGNPIDKTVEDTWQRIADDLARPDDDTDGLFESYAEEFYNALEDFKYLPAGRITAGAGTARAVTLFNCFVMGTIPDSMGGIFEMLREAALTMQQGGGIGYDFSSIRPKSSLVKKLGADASGPISFMDCWDAMCRTVMSAGSRRGAMMATMRCDHPDIRDFITAKQDASRLRMFNLSVLITDDFMDAVKGDAWWNLVHVEPPKNGDKAIQDHDGVTNRDGSGLPRYIHDSVKARDLWDLIMRSTYEAAEPGVIFIDRINRDNNLNYCETISSTNPCGEQPLPPYGACLLGSINLAKLIEKPFTKNAGIDREELAKLVATAVRMMDNVIDVSNFPLPQQEAEAKAKRRIGLGVTGLANALAMCRLRYGSDEAASRVRTWMCIIDEAAYRASVELAREKGAFPLFDADAYLAPGTHASRLPTHLQDDIREHGIRNALLTSIAPTGTISLYAGNVSSGIEPVFAYSFTRKVLQPDGSKTEELVEDYGVAEYRKFWKQKEWDIILEEDFDADEHLPDYFVNAQTLSPMEHLKMQAAAQEHVDSSISKTINCPVDISFEDFKEVYMQAYISGCKGCTTYRPNDITGSILSVEPKKEEPRVIEVEPNAHKWDPEAAEEYYGREEAVIYDSPNGPENTAEFHVNWSEDTLPDRPEELEGSTYKIKVGDQKAVYLTINDVVESDGTVRPFEIFLRSSDPSHDEWMVALSRMVSAIMRRRHDSSFVGPELMRVTSAITGGFQRGQGHQPSLVAAIGRKIKEHAERCSTNDLDGDYIPDFPRETQDAVLRIKHENALRGKPCPKCNGYNTKVESGCLTCLDCGHSKCG